MPSCWSCFSPKGSNGRGTATLYAPPSRELHLGLGCCLKHRGFFAASVLAKAPDILLTLTVLVPPVLLIQEQKQEDPHHSTTSKITLPAPHQTSAYVAFKWWDGRDSQPCLCTLKPCRVKEEMGARATAGAQLTGYNYGFPKQQPNSVWDGTLSSLNTISMQWE